jgi:hypothetical protein
MDPVIQDSERMQSFVASSKIERLFRVQIHALKSIPYIGDVYNSYTHDASEKEDNP